MRSLAVPASLQSAQIRFFADYWNALRGDRLMPSRADIDPGDLKPILANLAILEVQAPDRSIFRLCGTGLSRLLGFEATGRNYIDLMPEWQRRRRGYQAWSAVRHPCGAALVRKMVFPYGGEDILEALACPVMPKTPDALPQLIGVLVSRSKREWVNRVQEPGLSEADEVGFVDIGAGIPSMLPPDDWP